jgi:hypothetical protein
MLTAADCSQAEAVRIRRMIAPAHFIVVISGSRSLCFEKLPRLRPDAITVAHRRFGCSHLTDMLSTRTQP